VPKDKKKKIKFEFKKLIQNILRITLGTLGTLGTPNSRHCKIKSDNYIKRQLK
jgi:hypothetical protein